MSRTRAQRIAWRIAAATGALAVLMFGAVTLWVAFPPEDPLELTPPLEHFDSRSPGDPRYLMDFASLERAFRPQEYRSFCGPATLSTVVRAYGASDVDQNSIFPTFGARLSVFYNGMTLAELDALARSAGLRAQLVYADDITMESFRERVKTNLTHRGDFVVVNYDRRVLKQEGAGHISAIGAYDPERDAFMVLDEASYRYPFTWVPVALLYAAMHTKDGEKFRGVLFIEGRD
jgi:hypothetical protein